MSKGGARCAGGVEVSTGMGFAPTISIRRSPTSPTKGERAAWHERATALYEELRRPATGLIRRAYGSTFGDSEIEDIYSSAWLGTLRALERKHAELSDDEIRSYLLTAVANHASKEIRRRRRKPVAPLEAAGAMPEVGDSLQDRAEAAESNQLTRDLLSSLPPRRRTVMLLRYGWELEPSEICGMVDGLSPRAYRKEITKGVDDLTQRIKLVDQGAWCQDREPVLKAYAAGIATDDQALQAEQHISHCRSCHEFVGKLAGHLHDVGSSILLPGALEAADGQSALIAKARDAVDGTREFVFGTASRPEAGEGIAAVNGARGAGAAGAGALAKLSGIGTAAKAAFACGGGLVAASACVVAGIGPVALPGPPDASVENRQHKIPPLNKVVSDIRPEPPAPDPAPKVTATPPPTGQGAGAPREVVPEPAAPLEPEPTQPVLAPSAPPETVEFGVESGAQSVGVAPAQTTSGSSEGAVAQEFGP